MPNFYQTAMFHAERFPEKIAVSDGERSLTFADLCKRARAQAAYLRSLGVSRGDRVALMLNNSVEYLALLHASAVGGFSLVPVNTRYGVGELKFLLADCTPRVVLYEPAFAKLVEEARASLEGEAPAHWLTELPVNAPDDTSVGPVVRRHGAVEDDEVALIMYTSGTTSTPKGAMLTHGNLAWNAINYILELGIDSNSRSLLATPLFHIGGFGVINGPILYAGGSLHILPRFDAEAVLNALQTSKPTHLFLLSAMWVSLTESCVTTIKNRYTDEILKHPGSIGYLWRHVSYRLVDEGGAVLDDQRGPGELQVKGPTVFKGYWNQPELTKQVLDKDGWLHTGDIIRLDDDGFAYFMGRSKDMIKTGGENVAAIEVENCLAGHPDIREAAVFGLPHEYWGEELVAAVVPVAGREPDIEQLRDRCRTALSGFKVPKRIFILDSLPQSSSGKVQKFVLKQRYLS